VEKVIVLAQKIRIVRKIALNTDNLMKIMENVNQLKLTMKIMKQHQENAMMIVKIV